MKNTTLRMICIAVVLLPIAFTMNSVARPLNTTPPVLTAKITMLDGTVRAATLEGVGCSLSICSRVEMKGKSEKGALVTTPLDTIAAIKDITRDHALFVLQNGAQQRLSFVPDFRVLYIPNRTGSSTERIDLATIKSIEFGARAK